MNAQDLLAACDAQLRGLVPDPLPAGTGVERVGPLVCVNGPGYGGIVEYRDLAGLEGRGTTHGSQRASRASWTPIPRRSLS